MPGRGCKSRCLLDLRSSTWQQERRFSSRQRFFCACAVPGKSGYAHSPRCTHSASFVFFIEAPYALKKRIPDAKSSFWARVVRARATCCCHVVRNTIMYFGVYEYVFIHTHQPPHNHGSPPECCSNKIIEGSPLQQVLPFCSNRLIKMKISDI